MSLGGVGGKKGPLDKGPTLGQDKEIKLLQQKVAELEQELALMHESLEAVLKLTHAWAGKLSALHNTQWSPKLQKIGAGQKTKQKLIVM